MPFFPIELISYQNGIFIDNEPPGKQWYEEKLGKPWKSYYVANQSSEPLLEGLWLIQVMKSTRGPEV